MLSRSFDLPNAQHLLLRRQQSLRGYHRQTTILCLHGVVPHTSCRCVVYCLSSLCTFIIVLYVYTHTLISICPHQHSLSHHNKSLVPTNNIPILFNLSLPPQLFPSSLPSSPLSPSPPSTLPHSLFPFLLLSHNRKCWFIQGSKRLR